MRQRAGDVAARLARCRVKCPELGATLARIARGKLAQFPVVRVVSAPFEEWEPGGERFDMVFAGTAWHRLDPSIGYARAARYSVPAACLPSRPEATPIR